MTNKKILIIDFERENIEFLIRLLRPKGFQISVAFDGLSGLRKFVSEKPDLVILELLLTKLNGFELCNKIFKKQNTNIPVLIMTGAQKRLKPGYEAIDKYITMTYTDGLNHEKMLLGSVYDLLGQNNDQEAQCKLNKSGSAIKVLSKKTPARRGNIKPQKISLVEKKKEHAARLSVGTEQKLREEKVEEKNLLTMKKKVIEKEVIKPGVEKELIKKTGERKIIKSPIKIILANGSPVSNKILNLAFSGKDFQIHTIFDSNKGIESIEQINPDIFILDFHILKKNGYKFFELIKISGRLKDKPMIILKGAYEKIDQEIIKRFPAVEILQKPFYSSKLALKVKTILKRKPLRTTKTTLYKNPHRRDNSINTEKSRI